MKILWWPICALFGHEAEGLSAPVNTHLATRCICGRKLTGERFRWTHWRS